MINHHLRSAVLGLVALGAGLGTSAAFAQVGYEGPSYGDAASARPYDDGDQQAVLANRTGHFSCGYNEVHTRLERKNCGGTHYGN